MISRAYQNGYARLIMSLPGFDAFGALLRLHRRHRTKKAGLIHGAVPPPVYQGDSNRHGRMKKNADRTLTWVMMNAAMVAKQYDPYLGTFYERHAKRQPAMIARSHLANKMGKYIWHMLCKNMPYRTSTPNPTWRG